jgi:outer membrane lipoprotein-sorting protein
VGGWFGYSKYKDRPGDQREIPAAHGVGTPTSADSTDPGAQHFDQGAFGLHQYNQRAGGRHLHNVFETSRTSPWLTSIRRCRPIRKPPTGIRRACRELVTDTTEVSVKRAQPAYFYIVAESVVKIDRQTLSNTFAIWKSDKGQFMFSDNHQKMMPPTYQQTADGSMTNADAEQFKKMQHLFDDPAQLTKIIKDLGQTDDDSVNGQDCYTLTAKVLGQKVKIWVDKTSYLIPQWQITLGGTISDADVDDAFSLYASAFTNLPPATLDMFKPQVKKMTPVMTKIRGTITSTTRRIEIKPTLSADDFNYPVPPGIRLVQMPRARAANASVAAENSQRNVCINNLRQIDAAKSEFALEKGKANGTVVTEDDITPYLKGGILPTCPSGGKYTIGKVGETPTCSIPGHALP